jgi:hypothetical protein
MVDPRDGAERQRLTLPAPVRHLAFGADGDLLATACDDHTARVYNTSQPYTDNPRSPGAGGGRRRADPRLAVLGVEGARRPRLGAVRSTCGFAHPACGVRVQAVHRPCPMG